MRELRVGLGGRSYSILIGRNLLAEEVFAGHIDPILSSGRRVAIITNETIAPLYLEQIARALTKAGAGTTAVILPDGEAYKTTESLTRIYDHLLAERCDRSTTIVALGGGVVGDLAGFAAASYQRGIPFVQIPTTLLSQVDSSVGGKTGINHPRGKNMIGAFWQPKLVLADTETLKTLPDRELSAGLAEVIKYGLIRDETFLRWLEENMDRLLARDDDALAYAIEKSCRHKAEVVAADELETARDGGRALLNLGHTFGHAIETGVGYGEWLHGEAVAAGMVMAAELSMRLGWLNEIDLKRITDILIKARLPIVGVPLGSDRYLDLMSHDKKVIAGRMRLVLLQKIGEAVTYTEATTAQIKASIETCCAS